MSNGEKLGMNNEDWGRTAMKLIMNNGKKNWEWMNNDEN
jgi:hypothetical protein